MRISVGSQVIHTDLEVFLTGHVRARLAQLAAGPDGPHKLLATEVFVGAQHPPQRRPKAVVIRDDGGPTTGVITKSTTVGVTVLAGDDPTQGQEATELALLVAAIVASCPGLDPGNPVAAVLQMNGPYKVPEESGQPRRYFTADLAVTGKAFLI